MTRIALLLALVAGAAAGAPAQPSASEQRIVAFPSRDGVHHAYHDYTYADAVRVGDMIWVSGVTGRGATLDAQTRFALGEIKRALEAAGGSMADVVELISFHKDISLETFDQIAGARRAMFPEGFTAWTAVGTTGLPTPGAMLEIRAVAVVGSGKRKLGVPPAPAAKP